eukprot:TRINITY_DN68096_c0_g1_i1.p1 TRINITY_DN68096_c0_g1~~TRINITY_DN68096_c0_g1_i1.p1  ORF type:complete len:413 (-),score=87.04 TRINITY_DN68096_c0_g1_i1:100-1338(-)
MGCGASKDNVSVFDDSEESEDEHSAEHAQAKKALALLRARTADWNAEEVEVVNVRPRASVVDISQLVAEGGPSQKYYFSDKLLSATDKVVVRVVTERITDIPRVCKIHTLKPVAPDGCRPPGLRDAEIVKKQAILLQQCCDHPNIVTLFDCYIVNRNLYEVLEICTGARLFDCIVEGGRHTEREVANVMLQLLSAVHYIHSRKVCHRDIKPEHIILKDKELIRDCSIRLIDFSKSCRIGDAFLEEQVSTPYYASPQVFEKRYTELCDEYSCGITAYLFLMGYPRMRKLEKKPQRLQGRELQNYLTSGKIKLQEGYEKMISPGARDWLAGLLKETEMERTLAAEAVDCEWLKHQAPQPPGLGITSHPLNRSLPSKSIVDRAGNQFEMTTWSKLNGLRPASEEASTDAEEDIFE